MAVSAPPALGLVDMMNTTPRASRPQSSRRLEPIERREDRFLLVARRGLEHEAGRTGVNHHRDAVVGLQPIDQQPHGLLQQGQPGGGFSVALPGAGGGASSRQRRNGDALAVVKGQRACLGARWVRVALERPRGDLLAGFAHRVGGPTMRSGSIVSPEDQRVTFVELFFDLVFVFAVTQVVQILHDGFGWGAVGRAVLVFWLVWWAWTQFTWALNAADTTHHLVELATLLAVAVAVFMAVAVPDAFRGRALWFAVPYVLVRSIGLTLYGRVAEEANPSQLAAVRTFCLVSLGGLAAVLMGAVAGGATQYWAWGLAIFLDVAAAAVGGRLEGWDLHPDHFSERHGLFVIIALGESLIVAAGGLVGRAWNGHVAAVGVLAVAVSCAFWWSYFPLAKPELDRALAAARGAAQSRLARDVYSLTHFPMLCGIVAYAAAVEEAVAHPSAPLPLEWRVALAAALVLFVAGMAGATWRCRHRLLGARLVFSVGTALTIVVVTGVPPVVSLALAFAGVTAVAAVEQRGWLAGMAARGAPDATAG